MSSDTRLAFAHPSERAEATAPEHSGGLRDRISLRDYIREVEIGAFQQERGTLQRVRFNVVVEVAAMGSAIDDDVDRILSYDRVTEAIDAELGTDRINLLETLAARVADRILLEPQALRVFVRIEKIDRGPYSLGVEIVREAGGTDEVATPVEAPHPRVVFLSADRVLQGNLHAIIDACADDDTPLILCVDAPDLPRPKAQTPAAQRHIDLLAIEQTAWVLAAQDSRCHVVGTRTELDWAMRNGQICVWAPAKLVLDASDAPRDASDALALATWFAEQMQAAELVTVGCRAPDTTIPTRALA